jgi:HCOMODA/2-hydroxy-3-carboxy-muconic semialdehyde decarboxylase
MGGQDQKRQIVRASYILAATGVLDAFGHVSQRHPDRTCNFMISRRKAPRLVSVSDVLELDPSGHPVSEPGAQVFLERFIHSEIYRRRPDVMAVVHSDSPAVLPFTIVSSVALRPVCHVCGFLRSLKAPFDVAAVAGEGTDLLISSAALGRALADYLGEAKAALMRGHGFITVGGSIEEAVFNAVYTQVNARIQQEALRLGTPRYLTDAEAQACEAATLTQVARAWELWVREYAS